MKAMSEMTCASHTRICGHITDSRFFGDGYSTPEARLIFSDIRRLQRWLDVEVALLKAQADLDMIPRWAVEALVPTANIDLLDHDAIQQGIATSGHSLVPLLKAWQAQSDPAAAQFIHFGATTQDIQDTGQSLEIAEAIDLLEHDLIAVIRELQRLARQNRDVVIVGRSHGQDALPTTLGLKFAVWLDESLRNLDRLAACRRTVTVVQLFGGVGTMAAFGQQGDALLGRFAAHLDLQVPSVAWHITRDRVAEFLSVLALVTGGLANIGNEIVQLAKSEIGELSEACAAEAIGSSTMPHKRNPELSERVVLLSKLVKHCATLGFESLCNEHERDYRAVRLEWVAVADGVLHSAAALSLIRQVLGDLIVNRGRIAANVAGATQSICSEALMFLLSRKLGKINAYQAVYEASIRHKEGDVPVVDALMDNPLVADSFDATTLIAALTPANHVGQAGRLVDGVIRKADAKLGAFPQFAFPDLPIAAAPQ